MEISTCNFTTEGTCVTVIKKEGRCNYHKAGNFFDIKEFGPKGLCIEAYHSVYPFCLGMLYGADLFGNKEAENNLAHCPSADNYVVMKINSAPLPLRIKALNIVKSFVNSFYPVAFSKRRIFIEIVEVTGVCPKNHKTGEMFEFNLGNLQLTKNVIISLGYEKEMCPAAFNSLYPFLGWYSITKKMPWAQKDSQSVLQCPDHKANVSFEFNEKPKRGGLKDYRKQMC